MKTERTNKLPSYEFRNLSEGSDSLSADPDSETIRRKDGSSPVPPVMGIFPEESGGGNTMRIQTKMVVASLVVIALAFAALAGAAYVRSLEAEKEVTVGNNIDTKQSDYKIQISEEASAVAAVTLPAGITESDYTDGNTVYDGKSYYKTLSEAVSAGSSVLYCKPGADVGTACGIQNSVTVYGNNAEIDGVFTVDASAVGNNITVSLYDCIGIGGFTVNGVSEKNINININGCSFVKQNSITAVDSDSSGKIAIKNTEFSGYVIAVNAENCGSQDITVKGCKFTDCGTVALSAEFNEKSACAIRTAAVGSKSVSYVAVSENTFRYTDDNQPVGAEIIVGGSGSEGTVTWNSADGATVGDTVYEDGVKITSITVASGAKAKAVLGSGKIVLESKDNVVCTLVSDVLYISTAGGLYNFANEVLKGRTFAGEKVILRNDLDLNGKNWIPVNNFKGTFDGNGKTVSNFKVTAGAYAGFFGKTEGTVIGLSIEYAEISGTQYVGGIAGYINGTIENCNVYRSTVSGEDDYVGGIAGCATGTVDRCTVSNTGLAAYRDVGGIAGASDGSLKITNCEVKNVSITQDLSDNPDSISVKGRSTEGYLTWNNICCSKNDWDGTGNSGFVIRGQ